MLGDNIGTDKRPYLGMQKCLMVSGVTLMMMGMTPNVCADDAENGAPMVVGTVGENGSRSPKNWEWSTNEVAQTVMTTVNGAVNAAGKVLPAGSSFVQLADARIVNGYAIGLTIDNTNGQYQSGDTISIPLYGEMISTGDQHQQRFDLVRANGILQDDGATFARYEVVGRTLHVTLVTTPIGEVSSHLTITGSTSSPLPEAKIWAEKTGTARIVFGNAAVQGTFAFKSRFQVDAPGVATQQLFTKSDQVSVGSYYQDDGYMNALLRGDAQITGKIRESGTFATEDLIQLQHVKIERGTVLSAKSSAGYSTYYVVDKNAAGNYQATVISATVTQMNTETVDSQNFIEFADGATDTEIVRALAAAGRGAYAIHLNDDGTYTLAYNMGNPYADWGVNNFGDETFGEFLLNRDADGTLTVADLKTLDENIARAGGPSPSEGTGSHGHQFYIHFADNSAENEVVSVLSTYNGDGKLLNQTLRARAVTTPDIVDIKGQARLRVFYIDEAGHELALTEVSVANPDTPYVTATKEIEDYRLLRVTDNAIGRYGKANATTSVVYVYEKTLVEDSDYAIEDDDVAEPADSVGPLADDPEVPETTTADELPADKLDLVLPEKLRDIAPEETSEIVAHPVMLPIITPQATVTEPTAVKKMVRAETPKSLEKTSVSLPKTAADWRENGWLNWLGIGVVTALGMPMMRRKK